MTTRVFQTCLVVSICMLMAGCGGSGFKTAPVNGTVTLDGEPLSGAVVTFTPLPIEGQPVVGPFSYGRCDSSGNFELNLRKNQGKGAVVGEHSVQVSIPEYDPGMVAELESAIAEGKNADAAGSIDVAKLEADLARMKKAGKVKIPQKYSEDSPIKVTVTADGLKDYKVEMTSDEE